MNPLYNGAAAAQRGAGTDLQSACTVVIKNNASSGLEVNKTIVGPVFTIERVRSNKIKLNDETEMKV